MRKTIAIFLIFSASSFLYTIMANCPTMPQLAEKMDDLGNNNYKVLITKISCKE